jgi:hypothetical protein
MAHGLDWTRMGAAPDIAGSGEPEEDSVFLCLDEFDAKHFVEMNNTGGPVDVRAVDGVNQEQLLTTQSGYNYFRRGSRWSNSHSSNNRRTCGHNPPYDETSSDAYQSRLTLALDDGTVLSDSEARKLSPAPSGRRRQRTIGLCSPVTGVHSHTWTRT